MENEVKLLSSKFFHKIFLWAAESVGKSFFVVAVVAVFGVPLIGYLQEMVRHYPYATAFNVLLRFLSDNFSPAGYLILATFLFIIAWLIHLSRELKKTSFIEDNFNSSSLNKWSIPLYSGWTIQKCEDALGNMLSVTNSEYPGTLKGAYGWYDYEFSFFAKIDKEATEPNQNFSVAVRSENNLNGVMLQITKTYLKPHLLFNGSFIRDTEADIQLPTVLKADVWYKVKIKVTGNLIDISIDNYKVSYKIPTKVLSVNNRLLSQTSTLRELDDSDRDIEAEHTTIYNLFKNANDLPAGEQRKEKLEEAKKRYNDMPPYTKVALEFQKGSIGFRESGSEHAYFRNVIVKRCE